MFQKRTIVYIHAAVLLFVFNIAAPIYPAHRLNGPQTASRSGSVRQDGTLDFLSAEGVKIASIVVEIAETDEARAKGLMGRMRLGLTEGMLFIYERADLLFFWMKNTPISLDMIFVDGEKRIVHVVESTQPMSTQTYGSRFPARYVVEVPSGFAKFFKILAGMRIQWQRKQV